MFVSGSRLRAKRLLHVTADEVEAKGCRVFSMTDSNDRELVDRSEMAVLLPQVSEVGGSVLALALLEFMAVSGTNHPGTGA